MENEVNGNEMEKLINESLDTKAPATEEPKVDVGASLENKNSKDEVKDYRTVFKKDFRERINIEKYPTMDNFVESALKALEEGENPTIEPDEVWDNVKKTHNLESNPLLESMLKELKTMGVSSEKASKFFVNLHAEQEVAKANLQKEKDRISNENYNKRVAEDMDAINHIKSGITILNKRYSEDFMRAKDSGVLTDPIVTDLLYLIGKNSTEKAFLQGGNISKDTFDELNPLRFKN